MDGPALGRLAARSSRARATTQETHDAVHTLDTVRPDHSGSHGFLADDPYNDDLFGACLSLWLVLVILWVVVLVLAHCGYGEFGCVECTAPHE